MARDFSGWLSGFRDSIANYNYYIDFKRSIAMQTGLGLVGNTSACPNAGSFSTMLCQFSLKYIQYSCVKLASSGEKISRHRAPFHVSNKPQNPDDRLCCGTPEINERLYVPIRNTLFSFNVNEKRVFFVFRPVPFLVVAGSILFQIQVSPRAVAHRKNFKNLYNTAAASKLLCGGGQGELFSSPGGYWLSPAAPAKQGPSLWQSPSFQCQRG